MNIRIRDLDWERIDIKNARTPMIKKSVNIHDYLWDEAWRSIEKELGSGWDKKAFWALKKFGQKVKDVILTERFSCTLFNDSTILVFSVDSDHEEEPVAPIINEDDFVKSQLK